MVKDNIEVVPKLHGEKLNLCTLPTDEDSIHKMLTWINDPVISGFVCHNNTVTHFEAEKDFVMIHSEGVKDEHMFSIVTVEGEFIGTCALRVDWKSRSANLGILIGEAEYFNKGYGSEAIKLLVRYGFEEVGVHRIDLSVHSDNDRAICCYKKCGFKMEGTLREAGYNHWYWYDIHVMSILINEFIKSEVDRVG